MKPSIIKQKNRSKIAMYIINSSCVSRQEIANSLGFSMPTVFQNVNELIDSGLVYEKGEYGSTGGRKAKILSIKEGVKYTMGVEITPHHIRMVLLDLSRKLLDFEQKRFVYENNSSYYLELSKIIDIFIKKNGLIDNRLQDLIGIGIALPGIIDQSRQILLKSHALGVENIPLWQFSYNLKHKVVFGNDANFAAHTEVIDKNKNTIYLSLNDTVGGAIYQNGDIYLGDTFKSGEIGHMILVPGGKKCYCGKHGCFDAYCSAKVLHKNKEDMSLHSFFKNLENNDFQSIQEWDTYLDYLAIIVSNLRMAFDCDIILGGHVGGYMEDYFHKFSNKIQKYNNFDIDVSYIKLGKYKQECAAIGAARIIAENFIENLI
ncbi:MAG: ROK family protein [Christensenellaceae bacterium]|nr:ROK family protein [Christensenellaceae bacterium]